MTWLATEEGYFISEKHQRIAEIINDYDPGLQLVWIPPDKRLPEDEGKEFAVLHTNNNGFKYIVYYVRQDEVDERLLARLWSDDNVNGNVLSRLDALDAANRAVQMKEQMEAMEERHDIAKHILNSPRARYRHDGVVYE